MLRLMHRTASNLFSHVLHNVFVDVFIGDVWIVLERAEMSRSGRQHQSVVRDLFATLQDNLI